MPKRIFTVFVLGLLPSMYLLAASQQVPCRGPLSEKQLTEFITGKASAATIISLITTCDVNFPLDSQTESQLKTAGATTEIIAAVRKSATKQTLQTLRLRTQEAIRERRWDAAESAIVDLSRIIPENDEVRTWKNAISAGRKADQSSRVRRQMQQALAERDWSAAERLIAELPRGTLDDQAAAWRKAISDGRAADRSLADRAKIQEDMRRFKFEFVPISPGDFVMGCSVGDEECNFDENPAHRVRITRPFEIGKYEVTQGMWKSVMGTANNPSAFTGDDRPVERVSWNDIQEFLKILNRLENTHGYRLPTEAEWEYAARSGASQGYPGQVDRSAWHDPNADGQTHPVGLKEPNGWGLYDTLGNVWEWVADWYNERFYASSPETDPSGPTTDLFRSMRGGSWLNLASNVRFSIRVADDPNSRNSSVGFRCVRELR